MRFSSIAAGTHDQAANPIRELPAWGDFSWRPPEHIQKSHPYTNVEIHTNSEIVTICINQNSIEKIWKNDWHVESIDLLSKEFPRCARGNYWEKRRKISALRAAKNIRVRFKAYMTRPQGRMPISVYVPSITTSGPEDQRRSVRSRRQTKSHWSKWLNPTFVVILYHPFVVILYHSSQNLIFRSAYCILLLDLMNR